MSEKERKRRRETWFDPASMSGLREEFKEAQRGRILRRRAMSLREDGTVYRGKYEEEEREGARRYWHGDFDPNLDVKATLLLEPSKHILKKDNLKQSKQVNSYKYEDSVKKIRYIIGGFSFSTYIRRLLIHLDHLKYMLGDVMNNSIVPGWDLEQRLFSSVQMTQDLFREDLLPLIAYTINNKHSHNKEYKILIEKLLKINKVIMFYAFMEGNIITFKEPMRFNIYSEEKKSHFTFVTERYHDKEVRDTENILLFIAATMLNIFVSSNHYSILLRMLEYFVEVLSDKIATSVKRHIDDFESTNND